jgi:hypothetical protein
MFEKVCISHFRKIFQVQKSDSIMFENIAHLARFERFEAVCFLYLPTLALPFPCWLFSSEDAHEEKKNQDEVVAVSFQAGQCEAEYFSA